MKFCFFSFVSIFYHNLVRHQEKRKRNSLPREPSMTRMVKIHTSTLDIYLIITIKIMERTVGKIKRM